MIVDIYKSGYVAPIINSQAAKNRKAKTPLQQKPSKRPGTDTFASVLEQKRREDSFERGDS